MSLRRVTVKAEEMASLLLLDSRLDATSRVFRFQPNFVLRLDVANYRDYLITFVKSRNIKCGQTWGPMVDYIVADDSRLISSFMCDVALALGKDLCLAIEQHESHSLIEWIIPGVTSSDPPTDLSGFKEACDVYIQRLNEAGYTTTAIKQGIGKDEYITKCVKLFYTGLLTQNKQCATLHM